MRQFGAFGQFGFWPFDSGSSAPAASSGGSVTAIVDFYDPTDRRYAYRVFSQPGTADMIYQIVRGPSGTTLGLNVYKGSTAWTAINRVYGVAAARSGGVQRAYSIPSGYSASSSSQPSQSQIDSVTAGLNGRVTGTHAARENRSNGSNRPTSQGNSPIEWMNAVSGLFQAATPAITGIVGAAQAGGVGGSPAQIAATIAKKQAELARTTDPVKRARLQAEIQQLQAQQKLYASTVQDITGSNLTTSGTGVQSSTVAGPSWVWPAVIVGGLLVVGGLAWSSRRGGSASTALTVA